MKTIKVTGKGKISVKPDTIKLFMNVEDTKKAYDAVLASSSEKIEELKDLIEQAGFDKKDLKTESFNVDTVYESYEDKNHNWQQRFAGYKAMHSLKLEFAADNEILGKVLLLLAKSKVQPEFRILYTVKDQETLKNKLLEKAVKDSAKKAKVLAKAAGVKLGDIESIDYSWSDNQVYSEPMVRTMKCMADASVENFSLNIEAADIDVTDTVTVIWELV